MLIGLLSTRARLHLASPWSWLGFGIAILLLVPNHAWQAGHNWDSVAYTIEHRGATDGPIAYVLQQLLLAGPQLLPIMVTGVWRLWRDERLRAAAVTTAAAVLIFFLIAGKANYPANIYPRASGAGSMSLDAA